MFERLLGSYIIIHFWGLLTTNGTSVRCKIHFASKSCVLLYWQRYCAALEQWTLAKLCGVVSYRDRAAIPFDIGRLNYQVIVDVSCDRQGHFVNGVNC